MVATLTRSYRVNKCLWIPSDPNIDIIIWKIFAVLNVEKLETHKLLR